jgi:hypothetical protein
VCDITLCICVWEQYCVGKKTKVVIRSLSCGLGCGAGSCVMLHRPRDWIGRQLASEGCCRSYSVVDKFT